MFFTAGKHASSLLWPHESPQSAAKRPLLPTKTDSHRLRLSGATTLLGKGGTALHSIHFTHW